MSSSAEIEQFLKEQSTKIASVEIPFRLSQTLVAALERSFPFDDQTGNMRKGVLMHGPPMRESWGWSAGVGSLLILREMDQPPGAHTIRDFLDWYRKWLDTQKAESVGMRSRRMEDVKGSRERLRLTMKATRITAQIKRERALANKLRQSSMERAGFRSEADVTRRQTKLEGQIAKIEASWAAIEKKFRSAGAQPGKSYLTELRHYRSLRTRHMRPLIQKRRELMNLPLIEEPQQYLHIINEVIPKLKQMRAELRARALKPSVGGVERRYSLEWWSGWQGTHRR